MAYMDKALDDSMDGQTSWWIILGYVASLLLACIGLLGGGALGWAAGQGENTIIGAVIGFVVFFCIGCVAFGPAKEAVNNCVLRWAPMEKSRWNLTGNATFDLYITAHSIQNVYGTEGILGFFGKANDNFLEFQIGRLVDDDTFMMSNNPPKRTRCVTGNVFEEVFTFVVAPTDDTLQITLYDQDIVSEEVVGTGLVNITKEILQAGFPQKRGYKLTRDAGLFFGKDEEKRAGTAILSFQPGMNFPLAAKHKLSSSAPMAIHDMIDARTTMTEAAMKGSQYGTWATGHGVEDLTAWRTHHVV